jgi:acyl dehydratase
LLKFGKCRIFFEICFQIKNKKMLEKSQSYTHDFRFSQEEVNRFAEATGDTNPVHINAEYAAKTMFKKPIMHGMLGASLFSKVFGTLFPGEGTIYLKQTLNFLKPMYVEIEYEAVFTVKEIMKDKNRAIIETVIKDKSSGNICTSGEAVVMNVDKIK